MQKKEKKLPNRTDIPIDIPNIKLEKKHPFYDRYDNMVKSFTYTFSSVPSDWLDKQKPIEYIQENTTYKELAKVNLRHKAKQLLGKPFSASNAYNEFGNARFPNTIIECHICGQTIRYIVDFFVHCVLDHGSSLQETEMTFQNILSRIKW